jgi:anti-sigma regulatory factor (Ser/Thr protein kinase)
VSAPAEVLVDPDPAQVRRVIRARATPLGAIGPSGVAEATRDLELAVTEVVVNAAQHGLPPVEVELRTVAGRLEVTVRDRGPGPRDPAAPRPVGPETERGRGRWIAHRLAEVRERSTSHGYEVRLTTSTSPRPHGPTVAHD